MHIFTEEQILEIISEFPDYEIHKVLSRRVDSVTFSVHERSSGDIFVLKANRFDSDTETEVPIITAHCSKLKALGKVFSKTPNIFVQDAMISGRDRVLYRRPHYPYSLFSRIRSTLNLTKGEKNWLAFQLLRAVGEIHDKDYFHGNLSPDTIFVTNCGWLIVSDFNPIPGRDIDWYSAKLQWREKSSRPLMGKDTAGLEVANMDPQSGDVYALG